MREAPAIGIDLGTTNSCVGVYRHGRVEIIVNDQGKKTTPSFVAFTEDGERLVGNIAKDQGVRNFNNTIFGVKRIIGRKFNDSSVQADIKLWPFSVIDDHTEPKVKVEINGQVKTFCPEEISSMVLSKMKEIAEDYLGEIVENAVITVPAHFNDSQRRATKDAAIIAGLNVLRIINEPTAAAIAYGLDKKTSEDRNVLVFDLGGGTFDVSILNINDGVYEVKSTDGDAHLGGDDFDNRMVNHFILEFKHKHEIQKDLFQNRKLIQQVNTACERVKRTLSSSNQAYIEIRSLHEGIDLCSSITRPHFEELNADLFQSLIETVKRAILKAGMTKEQIDDVVLVGGSSRIPKIQQLIRDFFDGKVLNKSINPDEAVAYGAAVQADMLHGNKSKKLVLVDVTPFSLGIGCDEGCRNMRVIIERNTTIPTRKSQLMPMLYGHLTTAEIPVYEGEFDETEYNNLLGQFDLDGITPAPQGEPAIEITLDLDANGILNATAVEIKTGVRNQINISYDRNLRSEDEINRMIKENEEYRIKDKKRKLTSNAKCTLESYCINTKKIVGEKKLKYKINLFDKEMILKTCDETIHWLRSKEIGDLDEYELKQKELEGAFSLIISLAEEPGKKREKYREILNIREGASRKEINDAYRIAVKKYHPDVLRGNKEIGTWMFRMYTTAKDFFLGHM